MSRMKQFLQKSPIVTFSYDAALKIVFLILFSYTLLCQMSFKSTEFTNSIEAIRKENNKLDAIRHFSWYELTLFAWIVALLLGEITQVQYFFRILLNSIFFHIKNYLKILGMAVNSVTIATQALGSTISVSVITRARGMS